MSLLDPPICQAILGPTNTGKTHYAVERMLARSSGVIGLPLRLLAREVYDKVVAIKGASRVALMTGEEKIVPRHASYFICTVEAMPVERDFAFLAVDEIQLMEHPERGHVFTDRLLHARGTEETLFLGAETARSIIHSLLGKEVRFARRERFSTLSHAGPMRLTRLPKRSVVVAFSASEVYAIAELIRRYRGGAAVVMGKLSPRTRNAQAELYQSGEVDFLVATDAVGMGLNLDADHVAFASLRKFDGRRRRYLSHMEAGQIAGRAGRFRNNGTFGTTGDAMPMDDKMVEAIEGHHFEPIHRAEWRNSDLDFASLDALRASLYARSPNRRLRRVAPAVDELSLERLATLPEVAGSLHGPADVRRLWDICTVPDFRGLTIDAHVRMLAEIHDQLLAHRGRIPHDFLERRVSRLDDDPATLERLGVDLLSQRLAQIRTWTYCANRPSWMFDAGHWQKRTRAVEDRLSDALHESLIARFVDRRTSALLKGIGADMTATVKDNGEVWVDGPVEGPGGESPEGGHLIGHLEGLDFKLDSSGSEAEAKALSAAAAKAVGPEIDRRLTSMAGASHNVFTLSDTGEILWGGKAVGRIAKSGSIFNPDAEMVGGAYGNPQLVAMATERMRDFLRGRSEELLAPLRALKALADNADAIPEAKGIAFLMTEHHGSIPRQSFWREVKALERDARAQLWEVGVVFGQYDLFQRDMVRPKPARLLSLLSSFGAGGDRKPFIPFAGMTSIPDPGGEIAKTYSDAAIRNAGYRACGPRVVRFDILERLSRMIRQAQGMTRGPQGFQIMQEMLALLGCTFEEVRGVLESLGYKAETREVKVDAPDDDVAPEVATPTETAGVEAAAAPAAATEAEAPSADAPQTETPATPDEASAPPPSPAPAVKPKRKKGRAPETLHVFNHRVAQDDGTVEEVPNTEFWIWQRQPHNARRKGGRGDRGGAPSRHKKGRDRRPSQGRGGMGKGGMGKSGKGKARADASFDKPRTKREARRVEDSPFAALAGLKLDKDPSS